MSSTNLDIASDEDYHSKSEFYYPNETENYNEKTLSHYMTKTIKVLNLQWTVCKCVFAPAGFWPRGQNPRRHPRSPRVYTYKNKEYLLKK